MKKYYIIIFLYIAGFLTLCAVFCFFKVDLALTEPAPEHAEKDTRVDSASLLRSPSARFITDVVGFSTLAYFLNRRTPEVSSRDLARVISHYVKKWQKQCVFLIGYSYGADVLPFMISRLPETVRSKVALTVFIGLGERVDFQFHMGINWFGMKDKKNALSVLTEVKKLSGTDIICFYGRKESEPGCRRLQQAGTRKIPLEGGHNFRGNHKKIAEVILNEGKQNSLNMKSPTPSPLQLNRAASLHSNCLYVSGISYSYFK